MLGPVLPGRHPDPRRLRLHDRSGGGAGAARCLGEQAILGDFGNPEADRRSIPRAVTRQLAAWGGLMAFALGQLLTGSAGRYPDRVAVSCRDASLTYRELERLSNQLAQLLAARGVRKGDRVGICLKKSLEAVVAVFGILKAGAAYVPLDPSAPARRLGFIVGNCGMKALITTRNKLVELQGASSSSSRLQCVVLADEAPARNGRA